MTSHSVFLPGKFHGQWNLVGYGPWGHKESDMTEHTHTHTEREGFPSGANSKEPPANAGDVRDAGLTPSSGGFPEGGHGNPLQYSCLENSTDRGAWWAAIHRVTKNQTD